MGAPCYREIGAGGGNLMGAPKFFLRKYVYFRVISIDFKMMNSQRTHLLVLEVHRLYLDLLLYWLKGLIVGWTHSLQFLLF